MEKFITYRWIYCGKRGGLPTFTEKDSKLGPFRKYAAGSFPGGVVGGLYDVEATEGGATARLSKAVYIDKIDDNDLIVTLEAEDAADRIAQDARRRIARHRKNKYIEANLDPIRRAYRRAGHLEKIAIEVMVLEFLRR